MHGNVRLFSWVDVEEVMYKSRNEWPDGVVYARAYWDELTIGVRNACADDVKDWIDKIFSPRWDAQKNSILLESLSGKQRNLEVIIEETEESAKETKMIPYLSMPSIIWRQIGQKEMPEYLSDEHPKIVSFHSFKGGVGRTACALSLSRIITKQIGSEKVLLIDADFEAPGISWLIGKGLNYDVMSFSDLLILAHGSRNEEERNEIIDLVVDRMKNSLRDGIYIMPAFRSLEGFTHLEVKPEHLIKGAEDPFALTNLIAELGYKLGVKVVIIDLRAGLSELSTGIILDPRVIRVFVTTLTGQSVQGTKQLLSVISEFAPSIREKDPVPAIIFNQITQEHEQSGHLAAISGEIMGNIINMQNGDIAEYNSLDVPIIKCRFNPGLLAVPSAWQEAMNVIGYALDQDVKSLLSWLPDFSQKKVLPTQDTVATLNEKRTKLNEFAKKLAYAEKSDTDIFLSTDSIKRLCQDHRTKMPVSVIVGAKGAGKTYTMMQLIKRQSWAKFCSDAGIDGIQVNPQIVCVLHGKNFDSVNFIHECNNESIELLERELAYEQAKHDVFSVRDLVRNSFDEGLHEGQWRERWIDIFAWSLGFFPHEDQAGRLLISYLREHKQKVLFVIDGLEDLFQDIQTDPKQQASLRALVQEVPELLEQEPDRPVGLLVFVRRDMIINSVKQNSAQLLNKYDSYALKWNRVEAYRLFAWTSRFSDAMPDLNIEDINEKNEEELISSLVHLWGRKLGYDDSREGRSAQWSMAALSDLKSQIQARDIMRFLLYSSEGSLDDTKWNDRILCPQAIKDAIVSCSREKMEDIKIENEPLFTILNKLRNVKGLEEKTVPIKIELLSLSKEEIEMLDINGVIAIIDGQYYISEIFRHELGFRYPKGARPPVVSLDQRTKSIY